MAQGVTPGFPCPPENFPGWVCELAKPWQYLSDFDILVKAEEIKGGTIELKYVDLPEGVWGLHVARNERVRLCVNSCLSPFWRRFSLFHELFHLLCHKFGERFWSGTHRSMSGFENDADLFAWAAVWPEWQELREGTYQI